MHSCARAPRGDHATMRLLFEPDLSELRAYAEGPAEIEGVLDGSIADDGARLLLARFPRPVLVTDPHRIGLLPPNERDVVTAFFGQPQRTIEYDGVVMDFDQAQTPRVWSPSIDTLLVCKALRGLLPSLPRVRSAVEIGCGSGYITQYALEALARAGTPLEEAHLTDIEPQAIQFALAALEPRSGKTVVSASLGRRGEALRLRGRHDLILMNPPYIRRPPALSKATWQENPWEGVSLLREVVDRGAEFLAPGGSLVVVLSSLCDDLVRPWLEGAFQVETLEALEVPLKVYAVTSGLTAKSRAWMKFLREAEGLEVQDPPRDGYACWQRIEVLRCRLRG